MSGRAVLLVACLLSASGCLGFLDESSRRIACPETTVPAEPGAEPAPMWKVGKSWRYQILSPNNTPVGTAEYEVEGCAEVGGKKAYRVSERYTAPDVNNETRARTIYHDILTLAEVFDVCNGPGLTADSCEGEVRFMLFPLRDNATWDVRDDIGNVARATKDGALWLVETTNACDCDRRLMKYDPAEGIITEQETRYGNPEVVLNRWILRE